MSLLMIILFILILAIGCSIQTDMYTTRERAEAFTSNYQNFSLPESIHYYTLKINASEKDPASLRRVRLRQDLQHLMSTMVRKIILKRRFKEAKWSETGSGEALNSKENKIAIDEYPDGNRLERFEKSSRHVEDPPNRHRGGKIGEQTSMDIARVSERLMPVIGRSSLTGSRRARSHREPTGKRVMANRETIIGRVRRSSRVPRESKKEAWMTREFDGRETIMKMHAFVVRDEDIPPCCSTAQEVTNKRYFMCSGAILTLKHAITTASCIHFADIYEDCGAYGENKDIIGCGDHLDFRHHIDADLAIFVGATSPRPYVIKINRYEMHPNYDYDVDSKNHATNNVAILYLACSIVEQDAVVPSLPKGFNDDVAHMCCREGCDVVTIVQSFDNRQTAKILQAKDLPAPRHDDESPNYRQLPNTLFDESRRSDKTMFVNDTFALSRRIRSPVKLAAAPIFFGKESRGTPISRSSAKLVDTTNAKKRKKANTAKTSRVKNRQRERNKKKPLNLNDLTNGRRPVTSHIPILRALEEEGVNVEEQLAAVDWEKIEETMSKKFTDDNREKMNQFAKKVVDETMRRLETVLDDGVVTVGEGGAGPSGDGFRPGGNGSVVFGKLMPTEDGRNRSIHSFVKVFTKVVTSLVPPNSAAALAVPSDASVEEKDLKDPPPTHEECPPLGSPIFVGDILVGLLAYTCDDVQTWVEWKYVNIAKNMNWIRDQTSKKYEPPGSCAKAEKSPSQLQQRSLPDGARTISVDKKKMLGENSTGTRSDVSVEWPVASIPAEGKRRSEPSGNVDDARIPVTETPVRIPKDPWFARNSQLAPEQRSRDDIFLGESQNQPRTTIADKPVYTVNTCYVRSDGTADCLPQTDFNLR